LKKRADILLVEQGLCASRAQAQRLIMAGRVRASADHLIAKTSELLPATSQLTVDQPYPYVSRGAEKLLAALDAFKPNLNGLTALDIGASTGGFTDLLLQRGVSKVYAIDVGHGQLHQKLRQDSRVVCLEKVNARHLSPQHVPEKVDVLTADVSFISLRKILPVCAPFIKPQAWVFVLIKPQFEARREEVGKGGVVRDHTVRQRCITEICDFAETELGWHRLGIVPSPITGPKGNQESIAAFRTP
jgi:23S rRNA (cytidine1920-2'-O)/16S rRNA (cytidine1409-2'-O)-methyltransferase